MAPDPDLAAFRALLKQAESDPAVATQIDRLMLARVPLAEILALRLRLPLRH